MSTAFNTIDNLASIPNPLRDITNKKVTIVPPKTSFVGPQFTSGTDLEFEFTPSGDVWTDMSDSYINIKLKLTLANGAAMNVANITLNHNPGSCLFSKQSYVLNDEVTVSSVSNVPQTEAYFYRSQVSNEYKETLGSLSWCDSAATRSARTNGKIGHDVEYVPVGLAPFVCDHQMFPPGLKHKITMTIANDWEKKVVEVVDRTAKTAADYLVTIDRVELCLVQYMGKYAPNSTVYFDFKNILSTFNNITANTTQNHKYTLAPNVHRIAVALQATGISTTVNNPTLFKTMTANDEYKLKSFYLTVGNREYPSGAKPQLVLTGTSLSGAMKIWKDTATALNHHHNPFGYETFAQWYNSPFYAFNLPRDASETASHMDLYLELTAADANASSAWVFSETSSILAIDYSQSKPEARMVERGSVVA